MKTIFYSKFIITIIALLLIALNVFSQAPPPTTTISTLSCQEGTVSVPVTVTNFNDVGNISLKLNYDPAKLIYQGVVVNSAIPAGNTFTTTAPNVSGLFRLSYSGANGASGITLIDGSVLFTLTFAVKIGVTSVVTPITWSTSQGDCDYSPPSPGVFNPIITTGNLSTYFINGSAAIKPVPVISGPNSVCPGSTGNIYTTQTGMSNYAWNVSTGGIITVGASTNSITVTWPASVSSHLVSVNYTDPVVSCSATIPTDYPVNVTTTVSPTLTGPNSVCLGTTALVYSTESGMSNYKWLITGGTITSGGSLTSNTATVTWNISGPQSISVYYTPSGSCTTLPTVYPVTVNPLPIPTITGPASVCITSTGNVYTTEPGMINYIWSVSAGGTITAGGTTNRNTATVTWNTSGPQTVRVIYANTTGCNALSAALFHVNVNPLPVPTITGNNNLCVGSTNVIYYTESGMTAYNWTISGGGTITSGGTSTSNTVNISWNTKGPQTVGVNYANGSGCTATIPTVYNVTVNPLPSPTIIGSSSVCLNSTGNVYTTQAGMSNYAWTISAGGIITSGGTATSNTATVTWNIAGPQTVSVNYTNGNGCKAASAIVYPVTVASLVSPSLNGSNSVCIGSTGVVYTTETGMNQYNWIISNGGTITSGGTLTDKTVTVTWNTEGAQSVTVDYTPSGGCTSIPTVLPVTVNPVPTPTITGPTTVCVNTNGNVYTTQAGMSNYAWTVSAGGTITTGGNLTSNTVTVTWNTEGPQTVGVNYANGSGCIATVPTVYNITVNLLPSPTIIGSSSVCLNSTGNVYTTQAGMSNYAWTISAGGKITSGGTATSNAVTVTWNIAGPQTVSVNYMNGTGCKAASAIVYPVTVASLVSPTLNGSNSVCTGTTGVVYTTETGMTQYNWIISSGGTITNGGTLTDNTVTVTWDTLGAQSITVDYTPSGGCASVPTVLPVTINPLPTPTITGPTTVCVNATGNVYTTQAGMSNYTWNVSLGGTITAEGTSTSNTVTVTWNTEGPQTVSVNYTSASGCTATIPTVYNITVNPLPTPAITGPSNACFNSSGNVYTTETGMSNYAWTVSAGGTITAGGTSTSNTVTVTWNTEGPQTVSVNYTSASGCTAIISTVYNVTVNPLPTPAITGPSNACFNSTGNIYTTEAGMSNYTWNVSSGGTITADGTSTSNTVTVTWNTEGPQTVSVNYANGSGCTAAIPTVYNVIVNPLPTPIISGTSSVCLNSTGNVYTTEAGMSNYTWNVSSGGTITAGGTQIDNTITVTWNTAGPQTIQVNYSNGNGCTAASAIVYPVTVNAFATPSLMGSNSLCAGTSGVVYTTEPGMTQYNWIISSGGTITNGGTLTDNTVTVSWNTEGAQSVTVDYTPSRGCVSVPTVLPVTVNSLPTPTITGPSTNCINATHNVYTTQVGMSNYAWTVSTGGTITAGGTSTDNTVTVIWNTAGPQTVSVNYANAFGCLSMNPGTFNTMVNAMPNSAGSITGSANVNIGAQGVTYSIGSIPNATSYVWSIPAGATIASGDGTNSITVNFATNATTGNITVYGNNACGNGIASAPFAVTFNPLPAIPGNVTGTITVCQGTPGMNYTVPRINNATGYAWTIPSGSTIMSGDNTNSITVNYGLNAVSGNVTVYGTNVSGNGPASSPLVVTVNPLPNAPVISVDAASGVILTSNATTGNQWYNDNGLIVGATNQTYSATQNGNFFVMVTGLCTFDKSNTIVVTRVSIDASDKQIFGVYPNPSNGGFWVEYKSSENEKLKMVQVLDLLGKPVYQLLQTRLTSDYKDWITIKNHPIGIYILVLTTESRKLSRRVVITR